MKNVLITKKMEKQMMENRIEFLALLVGLNKMGVTASLINSNLLTMPRVPTSSTPWTTTWARCLVVAPRLLPAAVSATARTSRSSSTRRQQPARPSQSVTPKR